MVTSVINQFDSNDIEYILPNSETVIDSMLEHEINCNEFK